MSLNKQVREYLESDRQWTRELRIAHANYQLSQGHDEVFWGAVLKALKDD